LSDVSRIQIVQKIFGKLIKDVLMHMKKEDKRKTLMAMLLNKVNKNQIEKLVNRKSATLAV
jgi:hypothetical protein